MEEHNIRANTETVVAPPTAEEYEAELQLLRDRDDPSIQV